MKTIKKVLLGVVCTLAFFGTAQNDPFHVEVRGSGHPILLFPGFACTGDVWTDTVKELAKNYQCHVFTFAGFGEVPAIEKPWLPKMKAGVLDYISNQHLKDPIIIGHSLGGALALWLATESDAYQQVIVIDALPSTGAVMIPNFKSEDMVYDTPYNQHVLAMNDTDFEAMAVQMAEGMTVLKEKQSIVKDWILRADRETYVYGYTDLLRLDLREDLEKIKVPVTILAATAPYGKEMVKATYETQYAKLEKYKLLFAENSAHFIMYDAPDWFMNELHQTLGKL
ncbi:MAG: alpha/beta hydrolase [Maribacter sp.]